jgi:hypothetical protein
MAIRHDDWKVYFMEQPARAMRYGRSQSCEKF